MKLRAEIAPFSSVVGGGIFLYDETGRRLAQLAIIGGALGNPEMDRAEAKAMTDAIAEHVTTKINAATPFNGLNPAEVERLAMLAEEYGEVVQAVGKVLRHGYSDCNPERPQDGDNRERLRMEITDGAAVAELLMQQGDIRAAEWDEVRHARARKLHYSHHQGATA